MKLQFPPLETDSSGGNLAVNGIIGEQNVITSTNTVSTINVTENADFKLDNGAIVNTSETGAAISNSGKVTLNVGSVSGKDIAINDTAGVNGSICLLNNATVAGEIQTKSVILAAGGDRSIENPVTIRRIDEFSDGAIAVNGTSKTNGWTILNDNTQLVPDAVNNDLLIKKVDSFLIKKTGKSLKMRKRLPKR